MIATDPGSKNDMEAWANRTGNPIVGTKRRRRVVCFLY